MLSICQFRSKKTSLSKLHWQVELIYLSLPNMQMSKLKVAERVAHGGHNIPVVDIERRFARRLSNLLQNFSHEVNNCRCFMNSNAVPELVFEQQGDMRNVVQPEHYQRLLLEAAP